MESLGHKTGTVIISIDLELSWGNGGKDSFLPLHTKEREAITEFLTLCEHYTIPCTWATVGNLFLRDATEAKRRGIVPTPKAQQMYEKFLPNGSTTSEFIFGADIVEKILACKVAQEIGCHSFFHTQAPTVSKTDFQTEVEQACALAREKYGIILTSFVHPQNKIAHEDILRPLGFISMRRDTAAHSFSSSFAETRVAHYIESLLPLRVPALHASQDSDGLVRIPASYFLGTVLAKSVMVPWPLRIRRMIRGVESAAREEGIFHLWFHPHNIAADMHGTLEALTLFMKRVAILRESGHLVVRTMGEYGKEF